MTSSERGTGVVTSRVKSFFGGMAKEEVTLKWRIENFKEAVKVSGLRKKKFVEKLRFHVDGGGGRKAVDQHGRPLATSPSRWISGAYFAFVVSQDKNSDDNLPSIMLEFVDDEPRVRDASTDSFIRLRGSIHAGNQKTLPVRFAGATDSKKLAIYCGELFKMLNADEHLDEGGSLNLELRVTSYLAAGENVRVAAEDVDVGNAVTFEKCREVALNSVGSLLGDEKTSDVKISVVEGEKEAAKFFCHWNILSARSRVFRAMFEMEEAIERREGVVRVEDVSVEAMDQFLTFVYSGRLKEKRKEAGAAPVWVKMLPQLVYTADKYDVADLKEFCDVHFHLAVTNDNAVEMLQLVKRHRLARAEAKLRADFAKNVDVLLESLLK